MLIIPSVKWQPFHKSWRKWTIRLFRQETNEGWIPRLSVAPPSPQFIGKGLRIPPTKFTHHPKTQLNALSWSTVECRILFVLLGKRVWANSSLDDRMSWHPFSEPCETYKANTIFIDLDWRNRLVDSWFNSFLSSSDFNYDSAETKWMMITSSLTTLHSKILRVTHNKWLLGYMCDAKSFWQCNQEKVLQSYRICRRHEFHFKIPPVLRQRERGNTEINIYI